MKNGAGWQAVNCRQFGGFYLLSSIGNPSPDMDSAVSAALLLGVIPSLGPLALGLCLQISAEFLERTLKKRGGK